MGRHRIESGDPTMPPVPVQLGAVRARPATIPARIFGT